MTVGLPRSGKSTWAMEQDVPVVCPDAIRLALHGTAWSSSAEPIVWVIAKYMVRALFFAGHSVVILDATNHTIERRIEWVDYLWVCKYKVFETDMAECVSRAVSSDKDYLVPVISKMSNEIVYPTNNLRELNHED